MNQETDDKKSVLANTYLDQDGKVEFRRSEEPDPNDFDEEGIFFRMTTDENIFNTRGLSRAPKMGDTCRDRYLQMGCCAQMHSYEWTDQFPNMSAESDFPIVQVRFKNTHKDFFRLPENEAPQNYQTGDIVTVESTNGHDTGLICLKGELVRLQLKKRGLQPDSPSIKRIYRKARQTDIDKWTETIQAEKEMQRRARILAAQLGLSMKINNVEIQGDFTKAIFYYTAEDRVDFRQLIKLYAEEFKLRIEMRQIGARQESGILGGIGACGRELCCVSFLHSFTSVGTHTARVQQVSLNPQKLAGQCSKLKCCLNFEYDVYVDAMKSMPDQKVTLKTEKGDAHCVKIDPLKRTLVYAYSDSPGRYMELTAEQVFHIIEQNKKGETVGDLGEFTKAANPPVEPEPEFQQVVGQDDLTRFDKPKDNNRNRNKEKRKNRNERPNRGDEKKERNHTVRPSDRRAPRPDYVQNGSLSVRGSRPEPVPAGNSAQAFSTVNTMETRSGGKGNSVENRSETGQLSARQERNISDRPGTEAGLVRTMPRRDNAGSQGSPTNHKNRRPARTLQKPILKNNTDENHTASQPEI